MRSRTSVHSPSAIAPAEEPARAARRSTPRRSPPTAACRPASWGRARGRPRRGRRTALPGLGRRSPAAFASDRRVAGSSSTSSPRLANQRTAFATACSGRWRPAAVASTNAGPSPAARTSDPSCGSLPGLSSSPPTSASGPPAPCGPSCHGASGAGWSVQEREHLAHRSDRALGDRRQDEDRPRRRRPRPARAARRRSAPSSLRAGPRPRRSDVRPRRDRARRARTRSVRPRPPADPPLRRAG